MNLATFHKFEKFAVLLLFPFRPLLGLSYKLQTSLANSANCLLQAVGHGSFTSVVSLIKE